QLLLPGGELVNRAGDELLAGACLADHEHGTAGRRHLPHELEDRKDRRGVTHKLAERPTAPRFLAQKAILEPEAREVEGAADHHFECVDVEGLLQIVDGAELHGLDGGRYGAVRRQNDDRYFGVDLSEVAEKIDSAPAGHLEVCHDEVALF